MNPLISSGAMQIMFSTLIPLWGKFLYKGKFQTASIIIFGLTLHLFTHKAKVLLRNPRLYWFV